jgi:polyisoprenyl-teichoic acid--peptidoglycan teichoic acid transferase
MSLFNAKEGLHEGGKVNEDYPTPGRFPRAGKAGKRYKNDLAHSLPPLPALEDLLPPRPQLTDLPTAPLVAVSGHVEQVTSPLSRVETRQTDTDAQPSILASLQVRISHAAMKKLVMDRYEPAIRLKPLRKVHRPRRRKPYLILFLFILFGSLSSCGAYLFTTDVLEPLAQFFHPLSGDLDGSINGRAWNLLLLGSDNDNKFSFPSVLTQVVMVAHIDPLQNRVALVSIPRDSWVAVPGRTGRHKIDQAFYLGSDPQHSFDDGVRLVRATVEQDYGIPIDRYAWVGLSGFANMINTLGGLDIDLTHPIVDDSYPNDTGKDASNPYAFKRLYLAPGPQHLNGQQALEYVRSRHADLIGDIGRTQRQQEILTALKQKFDAPNVVNHLSALFHDLSGQVYTDLSASEMLSVASFGRSLPGSAIQHLTLGPGYGSHNYGSISQITISSLDGTQDIILPNCANIQPAINSIFGLGDVQSCQPGGS